LRDQKNLWWLNFLFSFSGEQKYKQKVQFLFLKIIIYKYNNNMCKKIKPTISNQKNQF